VPGHPARPDDGALTRSEEQLRVGHERVATRRARLVKYVVTEEVQVTVPLRREEVRLEYDDDTPAQAAGQPVGQPAGQAAGPGSGPAAGAGHGVPGSLVEQDTGGGLPDEIVLHAERPVVSVQVVPTERVRLRTEVVEGTEQVTEQLQREQVVVDEQPAPGHRHQHQPQQAGPHQQGGPYQQEVQRPGV
jgi:stress response protein YsnF